MSSIGEVIKCRAAVAWGVGQPLVLGDVEVRPPHPMEIRIKVVCTSLCRSDLTAWTSQVFTFLGFVSKVFCFTDLINFELFCFESKKSQDLKVKIQKYVGLMSLGVYDNFRYIPV